MVKAKDTQIEYLSLLTPTRIVEELKAMKIVMDKRISDVDSEREEAVKKLELKEGELKFTKGEKEQLKAKVEKLENEVRRYAGIRITETELSRIAAFTTGSSVLLNEYISEPEKPLLIVSDKKEK
jgi:hypothetical protein